MTVIAKPSEKLMNSIGEENRIRVDERKNRLGKKGLKELKVALENAIEENDVIIFMYKSAMFVNFFTSSKLA